MARHPDVNSRPRRAWDLGVALVALHASRPDVRRMCMRIITNAPSIMLIWGNDAADQQLMLGILPHKGHYTTTGQLEPTAGPRKRKGCGAYRRCRWPAPAPPPTNKASVATRDQFSSVTVTMGSGLRLPPTDHVLSPRGWASTSPPAAGAEGMSVH